MRTSTCKGCGKPIHWLVTQAGKRMPVDPHEVVYWENPKGDSTIITPNGMTLRASLTGEPGKETGIGYIPHWATCPVAERFHN